MKTIFEFVKKIIHKKLLGLLYLSLIGCLAFFSIKLGQTQYFVYLAKKMKSDEYTLKAIDIENSNPEAYRTRGQLFLDKENYAEALKNFEKASEFRRNDYYLWINIGYMRYKTDDFAGAEEAYQKSLRLAPNYSQPNRYMGRLLLKNNQADKGLAYLSKAARSDTDLYSELLHLARKEFPGDAVKIEESVQPNDFKAKKITSSYLIKHHLMTDNLRTFLLGNDLDSDEKDEFIKYLIKKREFELGYKMWASLNKQRGKIENKDENLIFDGGFEHLSESEMAGFGWKIMPKNETLAVSLDDKIFKSGKQSIKVKFGGNSEANAQVLSQLVVVKPSQSYRLTFAANSSELISGGLPLILLKDGVSGKNIGQSKVINSTKGKWIEQVVDFQTDESSVISLNLQRIKCDSVACPILGEMWLDDFSLQAIDK